MTYTIGILNADEVRPELEATYGDYPAMFTELLKSADSDINIVTYNVMKGEYPASIDEVDGYLLTGSKFSVYQNEEWIKKLGEFIFGLNANQVKQSQHSSLIFHNNISIPPNRNTPASDSPNIP